MKIREPEKYFALTGCHCSRTLPHESIMPTQGDPRMLSLRNKLLAVVLLIFAVPNFTTPSPAAAQATKPVASSAAPLDINTATPDQLKAISGIGDAYAKRIIDGRPYTAKNQLLTRGILPAATYNKIKDQIIASRPKK
jgi:hypothetical protein